MFVVNRKHRYSDEYAMLVYKKEEIEKVFFPMNDYLMQGCVLYHAKYKTSIVREYYNPLGKKKELIVQSTIMNDSKLSIYDNNTVFSSNIRNDISAPIYDLYCIFSCLSDICIKERVKTSVLMTKLRSTLRAVSKCGYFNTLIYIRESMWTMINNIKNERILDMEEYKRNFLIIELVSNNITKKDCHKARVYNDDIEPKVKEIGHFFLSELKRLHTLLLED